MQNDIFSLARKAKGPNKMKIILCSWIFAAFLAVANVADESADRASTNHVPENCAQISLPSMLSLQICGCSNSACSGCACHSNKDGFEGVSGFMDDVIEGSNEDSSKAHQDRSNQDHQNQEADNQDQDRKDIVTNTDDSKSKSAPESKEKHAASESKESQGFQEVSGSGEVPVYFEEPHYQNHTDDVPNDAESSESQSDFDSKSDSSQSMQLNDTNTTTASSKTSRKEQQGLDEVSGSGEVPNYNDRYHGHKDDVENDPQSKSDSESSISEKSNGKYPTAHINKSKDEQELEEVSGSGEVPLFNKDYQGQDHKNDAVKDNDSDSKSASQSASVEANATAAPVTKSEEKLGFEGVSGSGEVPVFEDAPRNKLCKCYGRPTNRK